MKVAIIPARGNSKRIPRKNIKPFAGKPIICWSIAAAQKAGLFDKIIVSTDDAEIADVAHSSGAEVPFFRPEKLSDDFTPTIPVVKHALNWLKNDRFNVEAACCIYATAPLVCPSDIIKGYDILRKQKLAFTFSATSYSFPIQRAFTLDRHGIVRMLDEANFDKRSQDFSETFHDAGQFYWGTSDAWCSERLIFGSNAGVVKIPRHRVQDIDNFEDWKRAELMFEVLKKEDKLGSPNASD